MHATFSAWFGETHHEVNVTEQISFEIDHRVTVVGAANRAWSASDDWQTVPPEQVGMAPLPERQ